MTLRITIDDLDTGSREMVELDAGGFLLTAAEPCHLGYVQAHANGTQVLTVKGFEPDAMRVVTPPTPATGFDDADVDRYAQFVVGHPDAHVDARHRAAVRAVLDALAADGRLLAASGPFATQETRHAR